MQVFVVLGFLLTFLIGWWDQKRVLKTLRDVPELERISTVVFQSELKPEDFLKHLQNNSNGGSFFIRFNIRKYAQLCGVSCSVISSVRSPEICLSILPSGGFPYHYYFKAKFVENAEGTLIEGTFRPNPFGKILLIFALLYMVILVPIIYLLIKSGDLVMLVSVLVGIGIIIYMHFMGCDSYELQFKQMIMDYMKGTLGALRVSLPEAEEAVRK